MINDKKHLTAPGWAPPPRAFGFALALLPRVLQRLKCIFRERDFSDT